MTWQPTIVPNASNQDKSRETPELAAKRESCKNLLAQGLTLRPNDNRKDYLAALWFAISDPELIKQPVLYDSMYMAINGHFFPTGVFSVSREPGKKVEEAARLILEANLDKVKNAILLEGNNGASFEEIMKTYQTEVEKEKRLKEKLQDDALAGKR